MAGIVKRTVQVGVVLALVGAAATAAMVGIAGKDRARAFFTQTRHSINDRIDASITDPVVLRNHLRDLEAQYPKRIAEVRGDLAELREQMAQLGREMAISDRVVSLADRHYDQLASALEQAAEARVQTASYGGDHEIVIVFNDERLPVESARSRMDQIAATRNAYASRSADIQKHMGYLQQQESRLAGLLTKLETERAQFQAQLWDLDRQVDAIARNDRMIEIMQKRQKSIDEQSRYRVASLDQLRARLGELRAGQESRLEALAGDDARVNYEEQAKLELDRDLLTNAGRAQKAPPQPVKKVIEIRPAGDAGDGQSEEAVGSRPGILAGPVR